MTFWPNDAGRFNIGHLMDGTSMQVMGEFVQPPSSYSPQIAEHHSGHLSEVFSYGVNPGSSSRPALFGGNKRKGGVLVKVIHAEMTQNGKGSLSFSELGQTYLNINVDTANVYYILSKARDAFNDPSLELVSSNGLRIMDNEGTKGY